MPISNIDISIVVPVYNEEGNLELLYERLSNTMKSLQRSYEIVFIDDGSTDNSFRILRKFKERDKSVKIIQLIKNYGQHPAIAAGFEIVKGEIIITIDADLQNPPEDIPKLINKSEEGYSLVVGWRFNRKDSGKRVFFSQIMNKLVYKITGISVHDLGCGMRAYRRYLVDQVITSPGKYRAIPALIAWLASSSTAEVKIGHELRRCGSSNYGLYGMLRLGFELLMGYSMYPLRVITLLGFFLAITGAIGAFIVFISVFFKETFP